VLEPHFQFALLRRRGRKAEPLSYSKIEKILRRRLKRLAGPAMIVNRDVQIQLYQQIQGGDHETRFDHCECPVIGASALR
jgi:hypothetical protein